MGRVRLYGLATALFMASVLTGCSTVTACPAIGWLNTVSIHIDGNVDDVAALELCADGECAASAPAQQESEKQLQVVTPEELSAVPSTHSAAVSLFSISRVDDRNWQASVAMTTPERVTLRVLSSSGRVLVKRDVALEWRRVGGSELCGGPGEAGPINLDIPS